MDLTETIFSSSKKITEEFKKQFTCLERKTKKYITFTVPVEKEVTRTARRKKKLQQCTNC